MIDVHASQIAQLTSELVRAREAYQRLDEQTTADKAAMADQVITSVKMLLRDDLHLMRSMVDHIKRREDPSLNGVIGAWDRLNASIIDIIGR